MLSQTRLTVSISYDSLERLPALGPREAPLKRRLTSFPEVIKEDTMADARIIS